MFALLAVLVAAPPKIDFVADVRPLFAKHCYACHGPSKQKSGFRLDVRADAFRGGDAGKAILPGRGAASPLVKFIAGTEEPVMPPGKVKLTAAEVQTIRTWIDEGAHWPEGADAPKADPLAWWSFRPLVAPKVPGGGHPVDAFLRAKLAEKGLSPSPEADRRTLIRRVTFDLTGLPPTPESADAFANDASPDAYTKLVDALLASPRYGERWARHWLDVVHYGDTHGYDKDKPRPHAWPYRDYVIRSFNANKPYSRFLKEQIAGDALYPGTADGVEALGFLSAGPWDFIGHAELPESKIDGRIARHLDRDDVLANAMQTFTSLTAQCAQCHDHKFDPISQDDYYSLHAVFAAIDRADRPYDRDAAVAAKRSRLTQREAEFAATKATLEGPHFADVDAKLRGAARSPTRPAEHGYHSKLEPKADAAKWVQLDLGKPTDIREVSLFACWDDFAGIGDGFGFPVRYRIEAADDAAFTLNVVTVIDRTLHDEPNPGLTPQRFPAKVTARYLRVSATKLASRKDAYFFALAEVEVRDATANVARTAKVSAMDEIDAPPRWRKANLVDGLFPTNGTDVERLTRERHEIEAKLPADVRAKLRENAASLAMVRKELVALPPRSLVYAGTVHTGEGNFAGTGARGGKPREIRILPRGDVTRPGAVVGPGALAAFPHAPGRFALPANHSEGDRRAALANWIADRNNPLTWRSIANRVWRYHFGRGLVETPNDFGRMGQLPTHPELLDWLAARFRDNGGDFKDLHRLLVTSAAYKQTPGTDHHAAADAGNAYYWRANRRKLDAEQLRDAILQVSGKLNLAMYGPAFEDFVVEKPEHSPHYEYDLADHDDPKLHRRSIYRFLVRSRTQPFMTVLDCADPSMQVEKRNESVSAAQALAMLNNNFVLTMAKHFGTRIEASSPDASPRVRLALRLALGRDATEREVVAFTEYAAKYGWANLGRLLFNLNEFAFAD